MPEVHQDDASAGLAHHVLGLDAAMQQTGLVDRRQRAAEIDHIAVTTSLTDSGPRSWRRWPEAFHPLDELGPDADLAVQGFRAMNSDHIGMPDSRE